MDKSRKASHTHAYLKFNSIFSSNCAEKLFYDTVCRLREGILVQNQSTDSIIIYGPAGSCTEMLHITYSACCATYIWQVLVSYHVPEVESCGGQEQHIGKQAHIFHSEKKVHKNEHG